MCFFDKFYQERSKPYNNLILFIHKLNRTDQNNCGKDNGDVRKLIIDYGLKQMYPFDHTNSDAMSNLCWWYPERLIVCKKMY